MLQKSVQSFWKFMIFTLTVTVLGLPGLAHAQGSVGTAFTFQGQLSQGGVPAGGLFDFEFGLFIENGTQVGSTLQRDDVVVEDGLFAVELDFGDVFNGRELFLEISVRPGDSVGAYTTLSPQQPLLATPYAQYSIHSRWNGLYGIPADLADGDSDTLYQAGTGLTLTGNTFAIADAYLLRQDCNVGDVVKWNGNIWRCAADQTGGNGNDHDHLGQTWTGDDNPLIIDGNFGIDGSLAPLVLNNSAGYGLRIQDAHSHGMVIDAAGADGIQIESAGDDGIQINDATVHGVYVVSAGSNGFDVLNAGFDGVHIDAAGDDGVHVVQAGKDAFTANSAVRDGLRIFSAGEHGVHIDDAAEDAVFVERAGENGMAIVDAGLNGIAIDAATVDGIRIGTVGNDGIQIDDAAVHGVYVVSAGSNGFDVLNAGFDGLHIDAAGDDGVHVVQAGKDAFTANSAVRDGLRIFSAGEHGVHIDDAAEHALFVEHTGANGLTIVDADFAGIEVLSAGTTGLLVNAAGSSGVYVAEAGAHGVYARSSSANHYGGRFQNTANGGRGLYARSGSDAAADIVLGGNGNGNNSDNGRIISDPQYAGSDIYISSNDAVIFDLDADGSGEDADFQIRNNNGDVLLNVDEGGGLRIIDPTFARFRMTANSPASDVQMFVDARGDGTNRGQLGTLSNHDLVFFTNSQPRMVLENNGDICIGSC